MFRFSYFRASILRQHRRQTKNREENIRSSHSLGILATITKSLNIFSFSPKITELAFIRVSSAEPAEPAEPDAVMPRCVMDLCSGPPQVGGLQPSASLQPHGRPAGSAGRQRDLQRRRSVQIRR